MARSSITDTEIGAQSILWARSNPSYASVCKVYVASHSRVANPDKLGLGRYDLSNDIVEANFEESFAGQTANLTLLPRRPYQNWVFPGDWLSAYVGMGADAPERFGVYGDPEQEGDDVRVFWGFVDSVSTQMGVSPEDGSVTVRLQIVCSGIQKALQRTTIYYNPMLSPETLFGAILPGMANLMNGLSMSGTPATIPRSIALAYLGFGGQFTMPESYAELLPSDLTQGQRVKGLIERALELEQALGFDFSSGLVGKPQAEGLVERALRISREKFTEKSIAQVLDLFSYVEDLYVDGRIIDTPVHDLTGNIWQLMSENCNPILNECFVSLKPDIGGVFPSGKDEWGKSPAYVPALVIRERPFSWLDGRAFKYGGRGASLLTFRAPSQHGKFQDFQFGDLAFSSWANPADVPILQQIVKPAGAVPVGGIGPATRVQYAVERLKSEFLPRMVQGRFVDRVKLSNADIFTETMGMSDNDHFNFIMISEANNVLSTQGQKYMLLQDGMIPTFLAESIKRYGLRINDLQTKFMYQGGAQIDSKFVIDFLMRTLLCWDMWYQHNPWYRAGTISCKGIPKARAGMYLDVDGSGRDETFYIEGVVHNFIRSHQTGGGHLFSTLTVTRGQPGRTNPDKRFLYAPQDPVQMFVGNTQIPREDVKDQPLTKRSPFTTEKQKVDKYYEIISDLVIPQPPAGYTKELFVTNYQFAQFEKMVDNLRATTGSGLTVGLISMALRRVVGNVTTDLIYDRYEKAISPVWLPPIYTQKEDRTRAGLCPWAEQENLKGEMWDPVARMDDGDQSSFFTGVVGDLRK